MSRVSQGFKSFATKWWSRVVYIILAFAWLYAVAALSLKYLGLLDAKDSGLKAFIALAFLIILFATVGALYRLIAKPKLLVDREQDPSTKGRAAILFVHGMGVQDRHQMLHEIANAIPDYTKRFAGKVSVLKRHVSSNYIPLKIKCENGSEKLIDVHEAYWGSLFNGLASLQKTILFSIVTLFKFIPTIFTRIFPKRIVEAICVGVALFALYAVIAVVYSGFVISTNRLERLYHIGREGGADQLPRRVSNLDVGYEKKPIDSRARTMSGDTASTQMHIDGEGAGILHKKGRLLPDGSREPGFVVDINGIRVKAPTQKQRLADFKQFFIASIQRAKSPEVWSQAVSITLPKKQLETVPGENLIKSLVFSIAYGFLLLSVLRFLLAQLKGLVSCLKLKDNSRYNIRSRDQWVNASWSAVAKAVVPLLVILCLSPTLDLLLVQFLATAVMLILTIRGLAWWVVNYMGDVKIYATMKATEQTAEARQEATELVADKITDLLRDDKYERVIILAHSLGSVIGTNAVRIVHKNNKICDVIKAKVAMNPLAVTSEDKEFLEKHDVEFTQLKAHVTIGSPLRKFEQLFKGRPYQRAFGSSTVENDSKIFYNYRYPDEASVVWFNYWYYTDLFADSLAHKPIGRLRDELEHRYRHRQTIEFVIKSIQYESSLDVPESEKKKINYVGSGPNFRELDTTGFYIQKNHDCHLGFRLGIWTHSDYWLDYKFVDDLLRMTCEDDLREMKAACKK